MPIHASSDNTVTIAATGSASSTEAESASVSACQLPPSADLLHLVDETPLVQAISLSVGARNAVLIPGDPSGLIASVRRINQPGEDEGEELVLDEDG
ncbi:unnamed protein product, partial [Protopolystoma xenopodis]